MATEPGEANMAVTSGRAGRTEEIAGSPPHPPSGFPRIHHRDRDRPRALGVAFARDRHRVARLDVPGREPDPDVVADPSARGGAGRALDADELGRWRHLHRITPDLARAAPRRRWTVGPVRGIIYAAEGDRRC